MEKWLVAAKKADFTEWSKKFHIDQVLARIIRNRDVETMEEAERFLNGTLSDCHSPWLLQGMRQGISLLQEEIHRERKIRVIGDYDVDGVCSTYILTEGLQRLGANVDTAIPHRMKDGYGLNDHMILEAKEAGVDCILTCDNGIAAASQVALAKESDMRVIITDHHEVPFETVGEVRKEILPPADAIIDPKQEACQYPFKNICGGVVAYKVIQALCEQMHYSETENLLNDLLPFAAMATVCDVMELKGENRIIVKTGLRLMECTSNEGLRALLEVNGLDAGKMSSFHLGFVIGPCLNATGRLDTALRALELLQAKGRAEAITIATELKEMNDSRKNLTIQGVEEAERQIQEKELYKDPVMLVYLPRVHESLAGIIAGRIREKYHHPVFVLTDGEEGLKGSGRSIETYHMYDSMVAVKQYFTKFGGHKLAAGLSMNEEDLEPLRKALNEKACLTEDDFIPRVHIDVPMPIEYANFSLAKEMEMLEPFGVGNPKPLFAQKDVSFVGAKRIGANGNYVKFTVEPNSSATGKYVELMYFGDVKAFCDFLDAKYGTGSADNLFAGRNAYQISVTYQIGINAFRGRESLQFVMQNYC